MVGEIHIAKVYFTDASEAKVRPVLLLKKNSFNDILYLPITSNLSLKGVLINNEHLHDGYLPKSSVVVYEKVGVIASTLLIKKIATLDEQFLKQIIKELIQFLQN